MIIKRHIIILTLFIALLSLTASAESEKKLAYVDLDGDGFNDNIADNDENGIPDRFESKAAEALAEMNSLLGDNVFSSDVNLDHLLSNSDKFGTRSFRTRCLTQRCNGFGAAGDFGPGNEIGLGAISGGGGCAGGVCGP